MDTLRKKLPTGKETVLLVDDEAMVRNLASKILNRLDYKVLEAENGVDAMSIYEDYKESIDILLTDVVMPKMNGRELSQNISKQQPKIKILFMSGYYGDVFECFEEFADKNNFLQKPFSASGLATKIREVLDDCNF